MAAVSAQTFARSDTMTKLLSLLRRFATGDYGIALGGAHAKGVADEQSDLDLYLFAERWLPGPARDQLCRVILGADTPVRSWGVDNADGIYEQAGTDFTVDGKPVECWLRGVNYICDIVEETCSGIVRRDFVTWTAMGYFNHCALSDLQHMVILEDPQKILTRWQSQVAVYPPALRKTIVETYLSAARFWPHNFHYEVAVKRGDILYAMAIAQQVVQNLIQVVFALNEVYFPGEKKLAEALEQLPRAPERFAARVQALVFPTGEPVRDALERQRAEIQVLVQEVSDLVDA